MIKENFKDLEVGQEFILGVNKLKVEVAEGFLSCAGCFLEGHKISCVKLVKLGFIPKCGSGRKDHEEVIFKEVE